MGSLVQLGTWKKAAQGPGRRLTGHCLGVAQSPADLQFLRCPLPTSYYPTVHLQEKWEGSNPSIGASPGLTGAFLALGIRRSF